MAKAGPPPLIPADDWEKWVGRVDVYFPNESWKLSWDVVLLFAIVYSCVTVPFRLGMDKPAEGGWWIFETIVTFFFIADLLLAFRVSVLKGDELILDRTMIKQEYLAWWFYIDAASSIPVEVLELLTEWIWREEGGTENFALLKLLRALRLLRLLRVLKVFKIKIYLQLIEERLRFNMQYVHLVKMLAGILYLMHLFGCGWFALHLWIYEAGQEDGNGDVVTTWLTVYNYGSGVDADVWVQYLEAIYWALMTLTTVGYGDIFPTNNVERLYTLLVLLVGAIVFGFLLSTLGTLLSNVDPAAVNVEEKLKEVKEYLRWHEVPLDLSLAVNRYVEYYYTRRSAINEQAITGLLTPSLRRELLGHLLGKTVARIPVLSSAEFQYTTKDFQLKVYQILRPLLREAREEVVAKHARDENIYFLSRGVVSGLGDANITFCDLDTQGTCFGVQSLMFQPSSFFYVAKIRSEIFSVPRMELAEVMKNFSLEDREQMAEYVLDEHFKRCVARNVALQLTVASTSFQKRGEQAETIEEKEHRMAIRLQHSFFVRLLARLSVDTTSIESLVPAIFGKRVSWFKAKALAESALKAMGAREVGSQREDRCPGEVKPESLRSIDADRLADVVATKVEALLLVHDERIQRQILGLQTRLDNALRFQTEKETAAHGSLVVEASPGDGNTRHSYTLQAQISQVQATLESVLSAVARKTEHEDREDGRSRGSPARTRIML